MRGETERGIPHYTHVPTRPDQTPDCRQSRGAVRLLAGQSRIRTHGRSCTGYFGTDSEEYLRRKLGDDVRWICPQFYADAYRHPEGRELFDAGLDRTKHHVAPLADCEDPGGSGARIPGRIPTT